MSASARTAKHGDSTGVARTEVSALDCGLPPLTELAILGYDGNPPTVRHGGVRSRRVRVRRHA